MVASAAYGTRGTAAFRATREAAERIDMRHHRGEHPRIGATDVCPFIPLEGASMEDCIVLARTLGGDGQVGVQARVQPGNARQVGIGQFER